jgi:hypothetical protein
MFPRVKEVIKAYNDGGLLEVALYFNQEGMVVEPETWSGNIKDAMDKGLSYSVAAEIELISIKFKNYNNVSKESSNTRTNTFNSEGHKESEDKTE